MVASQPPSLRARREIDLLTLVYPQGYPPEQFPPVQPGTSLGEVCELITTQGARVFVRGYWGRSLVLCFECFYFRDHWVVRQLQARKLTKTRLTAELGNPLLLLPRQIHLYTNIKELIESIEGSFEAAPAALQWSVCSLGPNHIQLPRQVPHLLAARATAASLGIQCPEQLNPASQPEGPGFELVLVHEDGGGSGYDQWVLEGRKLMVKSLIGLQQLCKTPMFRCWVCSKPALQICGKCHRVAFCSQECGQRGLQAHLQECRAPAAQAAPSAGASNS